MRPSITLSRESSTGHDSSGRRRRDKQRAAAGPSSMQADAVTPPVTALELRVIEDVLGMESGYVLDFSDRSFATFFEDFGVDIGDDRYCADGLSKAKRLRRFLRTADADLVGRVLQGLLEYRMASAPEGLSTARRAEYDKVTERLLASGGKVEVNPATVVDARVLDLRFDPDVFARLPIDGALRQALVARFKEAQSCFGVGAHLAVVILCGSVLEGLCMGFGAKDPDRVGAAFAERFRKPAPDRLGDWNLFEWLAVLRQLGDVSPTVEKYGHALRDFRNYVHPAQQLRSGFSPDEHNARIALQVVLAAVADLTRNNQGSEG
jgi:hypothetical protein